MAKKSNPYGTGLFYKRTKKKRPGRHSKSPNKSFDKMFLNNKGEAMPLHSALGGLSVGTPGALSALYLAKKEYLKEYHT
jgi:gamma-glutamyltranspeptidase